MIWDRVEGQWKQQRGRAARHWGKVMNDDLSSIAGRYEELVGRLQEEYENTKEEGKRQVERYKTMVEKLEESNHKLIQAQKEFSKHNKAR